MWRRLAWGIWAVACLLACEQTPPATQVIVLVDAQDSVRQVTATVHLSVLDSDGTLRLDQTLSPRWPVKMALSPQGGDPARRYRVTVDALDSAQRVVTQARLISGYVANEKRFVVLLLEAACLDRSCPLPEQTCRLGACVDSAVSASDLGRTHDAMFATDPRGDAGMLVTAGGAHAPPPDMPQAGFTDVSGTGGVGPQRSGGTGAGPNLADGGARDETTVAGTHASADRGTGGHAGLAAPTHSSDVNVAADGGRAAEGGHGAEAGDCAVGDRTTTTIAGGAAPACGARGGRGSSAGEGGAPGANGGTTGGGDSSDREWPPATAPGDVVKLPAGNWSCSQVGTACSCDLTVSAGRNDCLQPQSTCCLTRLTSDKPNCQCWPRESLFCEVTENEAWVESCPPKPP